jgi:hypothetical protein
MPRFSAIMTACVRSDALSLGRMLFMCVLTVPSEMSSSAAINLFDFPAATRRNTCVSRSVSASSATCSAMSIAISGGTLRLPEWTTRIVSVRSFLTRFLSRYPAAPAFSAAAA